MRTFDRPSESCESISRALAAKEGSSRCHRGLLRLGSAPRFRLSHRLSAASSLSTASTHRSASSTFTMASTAPVASTSKGPIEPQTVLYCASASPSSSRLASSGSCTVRRGSVLTYSITQSAPTRPSTASSTRRRPSASLFLISPSSPCLAHPTYRADTLSVPAGAKPGSSRLTQPCTPSITRRVRLRSPPRSLLALRLTS